jgi:hypothetical protein
MIFIFDYFQWQPLLEPPWPCLWQLAPSHDLELSIPSFHNWAFVGEVVKVCEVLDVGEVVLDNHDVFKLSLLGAVVVDNHDTFSSFCLQVAWSKQGRHGWVKYVIDGDPSTPIDSKGKAKMFMVIPPLQIDDEGESKDTDVDPSAPKCWRR